MICLNSVGSLDWQAWPECTVAIHTYEYGRTTLCTIVTNQLVKQATTHIIEHGMVNTAYICGSSFLSLNMG